MSESISSPDVQSLKLLKQESNISATANKVLNENQKAVTSNVAFRSLNSLTSVNKKM